jgi:hypothetical protein
MKQMLTVISIISIAVLANGNGLSVACVFFIIVILDVSNQHALGKTHFKLYFYTPG